MSERAQFVIDAVKNGMTEEEVLTALDPADEQFNPYAVCTVSIGKTAGTQDRSDWTPAEKERYDRCIKHVSTGEELIETN